VPTPIPYGPSPEQLGDLWLPETPDGPAPVAAIWHGGGYVPEVDRCIMEGVAQDLVDRGWAAWNLEYRRVGSGGGWPQTFADAADGLDRLAEIDEPLDLDRVVTIGFSAGAPLALWAAGRGDGAVRPVGAVNQAGLSDLRASQIVHELLGDPDANPEPYDLANPVDNLPLGIPQLHVHGDADEQIPVEYSRRFVERARAAGDEAELVVIEGAGHFDHNNPRSAAWRAVTDWLQRF
jgi:acetyl esterase/lipase